MEAKLLLWIVVASVPTGLMGVLLKDWFGLFFDAQNGGAHASCYRTAALADPHRGRKQKTTGEMSGWDALVIGVAQGVAIIPGISRSGATISTGLFRGLNRELAGKFSFLLSIPAILGATFLEFREIDVASGIGVT